MDPFWALKREPGILKINEFCETFVKNQGFVIFSSVQFRTSIWDPPGLRFGSLWAPKMVETCLEIRLGATKSRSRALYIDAGGLQERSKRLFGSKIRTQRATRAKRPPRRLRDAFCGDFGSILGPSWSHFKNILKRKRHQHSAE